MSFWVIRIRTAVLVNTWWVCRQSSRMCWSGSKYPKFWKVEKKGICRSRFNIKNRGNDLIGVSTHQEGKKTSPPGVTLWLLDHIFIRVIVIFQHMFFFTYRRIRLTGCSIISSQTFNTTNIPVPTSLLIVLCFVLKNTHLIPYHSGHGDTGTPSSSPYFSIISTTISICPQYCFPSSKCI